MIRVKIDVDSDTAQELAWRLPALFGAGVAPATERAFNTSARYIQGVWQNWTVGGPIGGIPNIKSPSTELYGSVKTRNLGPFDAEVYTESPYMERIVKGTPRVDMKETYPYGKRSQVSKDGVPYLIVPIRWATPNDNGERRAHFVNFIPVPLYEKTIQNLKPSRRTGQTHTEANFAGEQIERDEYQWGGRYKGEGNMNGMVRMGRGGSTYFTFRIISARQRLENPNIWIRKAKPPLAADFESALARTVGSVVEDLMRDGLETDFGAE